MFDVHQVLVQWRNAIVLNFEVARLVKEGVREFIACAVEKHVRLDLAAVFEDESVALDRYNAGDLDYVLRQRACNPGKIESITDLFMN